MSMEQSVSSVLAGNSTEPKAPVAKRVSTPLLSSAWNRRSLKSLLTRQSSNPESFLAKRNTLSTGNTDQSSTSANSSSASCATTTTDSIKSNQGAKSKQRKAPTRLGNMFKRQMWQCISLAAIFVLFNSVLVQSFDLYDTDCPDNGMRKPPRFGKRSHSVADLLVPGTSPDIGLFDPTAPLRVRRSSSDCFRGPVRRRMLRGSSSPNTVSLSIVNRLNSPLFKKFLQSLNRSRRLSAEGNQQYGLAVVQPLTTGAAGEPSREAMAILPDYNDIPTIKVNEPTRAHYNWPQYRSPERIFDKRAPKSFEQVDES